MRRASQEDTTSFKGPPPVPTGYTSWQQVPFTDIDQQIYLGTPSLPKSSEAPPKAPVKVPPKPPPKASAKARTPKHPPPTRDQVDDQGRPLDTAPKASGPRYSTHPGEQPSRPDVEFYGLDVIQQFAIQAESPPDTLPAPIHTAPVQLTEIPSSSQPPQYADFDWSQPPLPEAELCKRCKAELIPDVGKCGRCGQTRPTGWDCGASFSSMPWCTRLHCLTPHKPLTCQGPDEVWLLYEGYYSARAAAWWFDNRSKVWMWRPDCWEGWHRACFDNLRDELNKSLEERTVSEHELVFFRRRLELPHWA